MDAICKITKKVVFDKSRRTKIVFLHEVNVRFVGCRAKLGLEVEGWEVGFGDFAEAEGVWDEAFAFFDFDEDFGVASALEEEERIS